MKLSMFTMLLSVKIYVILTACKIDKSALIENGDFENILFVSCWNVKLNIILAVVVN